MSDLHQPDGRGDPAPWHCALVTGASSGIGLAMARLLVERGIGEIVLVARREQRLRELAAELEQRVPGVDAQVLVADLTVPGEREIVERRLTAPLENQASVDLLVNNAGFGTSGRFWRLPVDVEQREIELNVGAMVRLSHAALGGMVERGRGTVMNVSSLASNQPTARIATYGASKAFVTMFTESIAEELRGTGVTATAVLPGYTRTEFGVAQGGEIDEFESGGDVPEPVRNEGDAAPSFAWMTAEAVAAAGLDAAERGRVLCVPGLGYKVLNAAEAPLPRSARRWLIRALAGIAGRRAD